MHLGKLYPFALKGRDYYTGGQYFRTIPNWQMFTPRFFGHGPADPVWGTAEVLSDPSDIATIMDEVIWDTFKTPAPAIPQFFRFRYKPVETAFECTLTREFWYNGTLAWSRVDANIGVFSPWSSQGAVSAASGTIFQPSVVNNSCQFAWRHATWADV